MALGWAVTFITLALAVVIGFDRFTGEEYLENDIKVITESAGVEEFLNKYKDAIGKDLPGYRNHIYRVLSYTMHFLQNDKTAQTHYRLIEAALVFHDIGLWTDHELAYLEPSTILARRQLSGATKEELELVHNMIYWHHKLTPFEGPHANIVNAVRKADWIDASLGLVTKGVPTRHISKLNTALPNNGFHQALFNCLVNSGHNFFVALLRISSIFKF